jgi:CheY-like chemotaxis protein
MTKIRLVEDQEMNRDMLSRRLKKRGYEVAVAVDGAEGLEKAVVERPDLILMDVSLPVMDGWEATRRLKSDQGTRGIPVVALTAHAMSTDREKALEAGCDAYETKPVELPRLLETIGKLLDAGCAHPRGRRGWLLPATMRSSPRWQVLAPDPEPDVKPDLGSPILRVLHL